MAEAKESKQNLSQYTPLDEEENQTIDRTHKVEGARVFFYQGERECDANMKVFFDCIDAVQGGKQPNKLMIDPAMPGSTGGTGFSAIKITALGRPEILVSCWKLTMYVLHVPRYICV